MTIEFGAEIAKGCSVWGSDEVRPGWLEDNPRGLKYRFKRDGHWTEWTEHLRNWTPEDWAVVDMIRLPADHPVYAVLTYNEQHGMSFYPHDGSETAPTNFVPGQALWKDKHGKVFEERMPHSEWSNTQGPATFLIGYTRRTATPAIVWNGPLEAYHEDGRVVEIHLDVGRPQPDGGLYTTAPTRLEEGVDNRWWKADGQHNWIGSGWRIRNRRTEPQTDDGEWVRVKRRTRAEWGAFITEYDPAGMVGAERALLEKLGLIREPTPTQRCATALNLAPKTVADVQDWFKANVTEGE